jgi:hypothetical protein
MHATDLGGNWQVRYVGIVHDTSIIRGYFFFTVHINISKY